MRPRGEARAHERELLLAVARRVGELEQLLVCAPATRNGARATPSRGGPHATMAAATVPHGPRVGSMVKEVRTCPLEEELEVLHRRGVAILEAHEQALLNYAELLRAGVYHSQPQTNAHRELLMA